MASRALTEFRAKKTKQNYAVTTYNNLNWMPIQVEENVTKASLEF